MPIQSISIQNFRNLEKVDWDLTEGLNVLEGENAQGKTNLIESIYCLANGRSFRTSEMESLIRFGSERAYLKAQVEHKGLKSTLDMTLSSEGREVRLQEKPLTRMNQVFEILRVLIFTPETTGLFRSTPAVRRRYFDFALALHHPAYGRLLNRYRRVLRQRNLWIEQGRDPQLWESFDRPWAETASEIFRERNRYLEELNPLWQNRLMALTRSLPPFEVRWKGPVRAEDREDPLALEEALQATAPEENRYRCTVLGPQREDLVLSFDGVSVREMASQGQQRMLTIALKLAEADLFTQKTSIPPVFLLDDIGSELDEGHRDQMLGMLGEIHSQTILTTAQPGAFGPLKARTYRVKQGKITKTS